MKEEANETMTARTNLGTSDQPSSDQQLAALERDVAVADRAFSESLHEASEAGLQVTARVRGAQRPVLVGALVLGGAIVHSVYWWANVRPPSAVQGVGMS